MIIGDIEKYLDENCNLEDTKELDKALMVVMKHLPKQLVSELYLEALTISVYAVKRKKGYESVQDMLNRLCKEHDETEEYIRDTAVDVAMQTVQGLKHGEIFDMLGLEDDNTLFEFIDIEMVLNL